MELQASVIEIRKVCLAMSMILLGGSLTAQENHVLNGDFETISTCDLNYGDIEIAEGWSTFYFGDFPPTPDLFNECANISYFGVPDNDVGSQTALSGNGYAGFVPIAVTESLFGTLTDPLQKDTLYHVSFHLSLADRWQKAMRDIGLVFLDSLYTIDADSFYTIEPDLVETDWITDKQGWHLVDTVYKADGNETHLAIGYFPNEDIYETLPGQGGDINSTYYYVDDVTVIPYSVWLGTKEVSIEKKELSIYPNPSSGEFTLDLGNCLNAGSRYSLTVADITGKQVFERTVTCGQQNLNLGNLDNGTYLLRIISADDAERWNFKLLLLK